MGCTTSLRLSLSLKNSLRKNSTTRCVARDSAASGTVSATSARARPALSSSRRRKSVKTASSMRRNQAKIARTRNRRACHQRIRKAELGDGGFGELRRYARSLGGGDIPDNHKRCGSHSTAHAHLLVLLLPQFQGSAAFSPNARSLRTPCASNV